MRYVCLGAVAASQRGERRVVYDYRILPRYSARKPFAELSSLCLRLDMGISLTGLVNFVLTIQLRSPCAGENDAINT